MIHLCVRKHILNLRRLLARLDERPALRDLHDRAVLHELGLRSALVVQHQIHVQIDFLFLDERVLLLLFSFVQVEVNQLLLAIEFFRVVIGQQRAQIGAVGLGFGRQGEKILFFRVNIHKIILPKKYLNTNKYYLISQYNLPPLCRPN